MLGPSADGGAGKNILQLHKELNLKIKIHLHNRGSQWQEVI